MKNIGAMVAAFGSGLSALDDIAESLMSRPDQKPAELQGVVDTARRKMQGELLQLTSNAIGLTSGAAAVSLGGHSALSGQQPGKK